MVYYCFDENGIFNVLYFLKVFKFLI